MRALGVAFAALAGWLMQWPVHGWIGNNPAIVAFVVVWARAALHAALGRRPVRLFSDFDDREA